MNFANFFILFSVYAKRSKKDTPKSVTHETETRRLPKKLLSIALPVAMSACARSGLISLEHVLIPIGLRKSGSSREHALAAYGTLQSMALPIILFPSALISSFSGLLVPEITECRVKNNTRQIQYISERMLQLSLLFSIGVAGVMIFFSREIGDVIYPGKNTDKYIWLLAPLIPIMYVDSGVDAILKGMGKQLYSMIVNIVDAALSVILVWTLLPKYGIYGFIITIYVTETVNTVLSIFKLINISHIKPKLCKWILGPLFCIVGATCTARLLLPSPDLLPSSALTLTLHIILVTALYFLYLTLCRVLDKEDLDWAIKILRKETPNQ